MNMRRENQITISFVFVFECFFFSVVNLVTTINSSKAGVIPVARCRSRCLSKFLKDDVNDEECRIFTPCVSCWNVCDDIFSKPDVWKEPCRRKQICHVGCMTACKFRKSLSRIKQSDLERTFSEIPAVTIEPRIRRAVVAWSTPVRENDVSGTIHQNLVYVLFARDRNKNAGSAWKQAIQTSSTFAIMDVTALPSNPEFWLLAVGEGGTEAEIRFNASVSPYTEGVIIVPERSEIRINEGATVEYDKDSTLKLNMTMPVVDGVLQPTVSWTNPDPVSKRGNQLTYTIHYYLHSCNCDWPEEHFSKILYVDTFKQPTISLENIAFNAVYLIEILLKSDRRWHGEVTAITPSCSQTDSMNPAKCLTEVSVTHHVIFKTTTPSPKTALMSVGNETHDVDAGHQTSLSGRGFDWNLRNTGMEYDITRQEVLVHLKWSLPFNHSAEVSQEVVYSDIPDAYHVHADRDDNVSVTEESNSIILKLQPFRQYQIYVKAIYGDDNDDKQNEFRSGTLDVNTNITDQTPLASVARASSIDHEKDILNGIILGVTVVSSVIIFGIIIVFVYKKRQSFRDIIITKTTVAKSNSYKSNVGCKVDYSNQSLITNDDWEVDCRQLKFASHIGQGAFGKVVTGYYQDQRVAIKLVRDCAPISYKEDLLAEISLMKRLGSHPNIVSMVGACTLAEPICLVMEYAPYGNLQNFLKKCRLEGELTIQAGRSPELNYSFMDEHGGINEGVVTPADLLSFARQVSMAMEYLGEKKYVHRDLAARNVLLGYDKIIKVCDFGLSRDVFNDNQYKKLTNGKLPLKWMAVESLRDRIFTTQSDVWSFGILLWEIVTMGASPYPNIALADLFYLLSNSYRMEKPSNCSDEIYVIMRQCWLENPVDRPNFTDLRVQLEHLLTRDRNYLELDNINVPLSTPESSSGSPVSDDTKSLLAAKALQPQRKSSKDELTVNISIHDKSVERLLKRKGDFDAHNITIL